MKKTLLLIIILLLFSLIVIISPFFKSLAQAEDFSLSLSSVQGNLGETVTLTLDIDYPNQPIAIGFNLDINYDPNVLENPSAQASDALIQAGKVLDAREISAGVFRILVIGFNSTLIQSGQALIISFDIKSDALPGQTDLILNNMSGTTQDFQELSNIIGINGSIMVNQIILPTDLNQDGQVDSQDLNIFKSVWGSVSSIADFNQDGLVNSKDLGIMMSSWKEQ